MNNFSQGFSYNTSKHKSKANLHLSKHIYVTETESGAVYQLLYGHARSKCKQAEKNQNIYRIT